MKSEKRRPVLLEDVLRLKRLERPSEEFWADFDRQLRAKQLSALVGRRPWLQSLTLARFFSAVRLYHLPLGAAAVLAITFVSIRVNHSEAPLTVRTMSPEPVAAAVAMPLVSSGIEGGSVQVAVEKSEVVAGVTLVEGRETDLAAANDQSAAGALASFNPLPGAISDVLRTATTFRGLRYVEPALISVSSTEPAMARTLLNSASRLEVQAIPSRPAVEPLHQITPPAERRGTRILTAMVSMASVEHAMRTTERAASRLSEEQLYDQIHRFGARGAGVNVKF